MDGASSRRTFPSTKSIRMLRRSPSTVMCVHPWEASISVQMDPPMVTVQCPVWYWKRGRTTRTNGGALGNDYGKRMSSSTFESS
eukprot:2089466-Prymnesium_polylepis.1